MTELSANTKSAIIHTVLNTDVFLDDCEIFSIRGEEGVKRYQATCSCSFDENIAVIFSLPTNSNNIFITVTDGEPKIVRQVIAALEDIDSHSQIKLGNVQLIDDPDLKKNNVFGVVLLPVATSNVLGFIPERIEVNSIQYTFLLVVFLTDEEHLIWKEKGHDALIDFFALSSKDLVALG